ncbi:MAG: sialate O-acetylesterase [bacterium]
MKRTSAFVLFLMVALGLSCSASLAGWEIPSIISSNMVLQQNSDAPLWGWDEPGTTVTVSFREKTVTTQTGSDGKWQLRLPTGKAGGPFVLHIKGSRELTLEGVLVGEVWVAGGQSNMWWHEGGCKEAAREREDADYPMIRIWDANTSTNQAGWPSDTTQRTVKAEWTPVSPGMVANTPGVPFFFARELHKLLKVPVGIVHIAVPGQAIETFLSPSFITANLPLAREQSEHQKRPAPSCFYNGMVAPVAPYAAKGFLWWQGESNADRHLQYRGLFTGLIDDWRHAWGENDAPFLYVELANFLKPQVNPVENDQWPALRDAQSYALALDHVHAVSAIDILGPAESPFNIHPPNKQLIGHRLVLAARANVYGEKRLVWSGPRYKSVEFDGNRAILTFTHIGGKLMSKDSLELKGFALAGADRQFKWAQARIVRNTVVVSSPEVPVPVAVRYDWANNPIGNLVNKEGLPAFPFRTDSWNLVEK